MVGKFGDQIGDPAAVYFTCDDLMHRDDRDVQFFGNRGLCPARLGQSGFDIGWVYFGLYSLNS